MTPLAIGIGHPFRRDDGIGAAVAEALTVTDIDVLIHHGEGTDLMARWAGRDLVVAIDATASGAPAGTIRTWDAVAAPLPAGLLPKGSHLFGLAEAIELARLLGTLPASLMVVGVEGADFSTGQGFSPDVAAALPLAVGVVERLLATHPI